MFCLCLPPPPQTEIILYGMTGGGASLRHCAVKPMHTAAIMGIRGAKLLDKCLRAFAGCKQPQLAPAKEVSTAIPRHPLNSPHLWAVMFSAVAHLGMSRANLLYFYDGCGPASRIAAQVRPPWHLNQCDGQAFQTPPPRATRTPLLLLLL